MTSLEGNFDKHSVRLSYALPIDFRACLLNTPTGLMRNWIEENLDIYKVSTFEYVPGAF